MSIYKNGKLIAGGRQCMPLLSFMWADHQLNDISWLRADTFSWQSGDVYTAVYQHLADDIDGKTLQSETVGSTTIQFYLADDGHKICPASEESNVTAIYNATGVAWYYIIDTVNQRFKLPRSKHNKYADTVAVIGDGKALGLTDGTQELGLGYYANNSYYTAAAKNNSGKTVGSAFDGTGTTLSNKILGVSTDATKSGMIAQQEQDTDQYKYLYFYVGNFTQTAIENTAGLNAELFNGKADVSALNTKTAHVVTEFQEPTSANNYTWYRKYADGWVEQGGTFGAAFNQYSTKTVTLPVQMSDTNYFGFVTTCGNGTNYTSQIEEKTTTTAKFSYIINLANNGACWMVCGMAAN